MIEVSLSRRDSRTVPPVITSANGQVMSICAREPDVRDLVLSADLIHADGMPLVFASHLKYRAPLPERVATTDLFHDVAAIAEKRGVSFYFLGAPRAVLEQAVANVQRRYPDLIITGFASGYFTPDQESSVVRNINAARPDILWLGLGAPLEQMFAERNREKLHNVGLIKTAGGLFDFLSGRNRRAPGWMQSAGLEWLFRAVLEPRRLLYRYLTTTPHAVYLLLTAPSHEAPVAHENDTT